MKITNESFLISQRIRARAETAPIYIPVSEWSYSHHPHLTFFAGRLHAIWSNGRVNEDDAGQRVMISSSSDFYNWSTPVPLVDTKWGKHSELVLTAAGFHQYNNKLTAYIGQYEYKPEHLEEGKRKQGDHGHQDTTLLALSADEDMRWGGLVDLGIPIIPNHGPQKLQSGRLLISGNIMFPYTDELPGLQGWRKSGIYPSVVADSVVDDSESFWQIKKLKGWSAGLCEGSFYQLENGTIVMLLRSGTSKLWSTLSEDNGVTWSEPEQTEFSDNNTKFHFGRLSDGRYYYVGSPDPKGSRNPLVLSLSDDGQRFDRHYILQDKQEEPKFAGLYKGGQYGYPHSIVHDGFIYVIYSICKEQISVTRVRIDSL